MTNLVQLYIRYMSLIPRRNRRRPPQEMEPFIVSIILIESFRSVLRLMPLSVRQHPKLQTSQKFITIVCLGMPNSGARAEVLNAAPGQSFFVTHAVRVVDLAVDDVSEYLKILVGMLPV